MTNNAFGRRMGQKFKKSHNEAGTFYQGIGTKADGFLTDYEPDGKNSQLISILNPRVKNKVEKPPYSVSTHKIRQDFAELPNCPVCGRNEWTYSPDGELLCPCGYRHKGASNAG